MPKRKGFLYEWMCDKEHIREAIVFGAKDKHDRRDVRRVLADVDGYTDRVYDLLQTQTFAPAQPKKRKIFDNSSRKWREIEPLAWQKCHVRGFLFCAALAARYAVFISAH